MDERGGAAPQATLGEAGAAPAAVAPPPGHPRFPLLDSLRAIAALSVLVGHVGFLSDTQQTHWYGALMAQLITGVPIFFVLSGFLLYRPFFSSELEPTPRPRVRDFTRRRLLRIVPAYWLALTVLAIEPGLPDVFTHDWWRYYFFLQIYQPFTRAFGLTVAWTLCIEVSFYLTLPIYAAVTRRLSRGLGRRGRIRFQLGLLAALALASLSLGYVRDARVAPSLLTHFDWFAGGMALAVISVATHAREHVPAPVRWARERPAACWTVALTVYVAMCAVLSSAPGYSAYSHPQVVISHVGEAVVAFLLVAPAALGGERGGWPRRLLGLRGLAWLGLISYGIYLWHLTLATWLYGKGARGFVPLLMLTVGTAVTCAAASYYVVERPLLRLKDRRLPFGGRGRRRSAPEEARPAGVVGR